MRQQTPAIATTAERPEYSAHAVRVAEFDRPMMSDDVETAQTVAYMEELASFDAGSCAVLDATQRALSDAGLTMASDPAEIFPAIFWFLKRTIRYVPTPATSALVDQTLIAPAAMLAMKNPEGDCPQFSMLAAAMFRVLCIPCYFKTIAADPDYPDTYSHIYNVVEINGQRLPFDSSNGPAPGSEYAQAFKRRVWPRTLPDRCTVRPKGRSTMTQTGMMPRSWRNRQLRGRMGTVTCDSDGNCYDDSTGTYTTSTPTAPSIPGGYGATVPVDMNTLATSIGQNTSLIAPPVSTSGASTTGFFTTLANDLTSLASPVVKALTTQQPYYITNAQGQQVLYNPATGTTIGGLSAALSGSSGPLLIGAAIIGVLLLSRK